MMLKHKNKKGIFIIEAMVAVMIFLIGTLGILKYQGDTILSTSQTQYRITAAFLAESLVGSMWLSRGELSKYVDKTHKEYLSWIEQVNTSLPGAADNPPTITVETSDEGISTINITIKWQHNNGQTSSHSLSSTIY